MPSREFQTYFHDRASRFSAFYASEPVSRVLGRGPLFDRLRLAVAMTKALSAQRVLDVGCGSGPLFSPLAEQGIQVTGIDPAANMVALASAQAEAYPGLVRVEQRGWEQIDEVDAYDVAIALGVFDYVDQPADLLGRMGRAGATWGSSAIRPTTTRPWPDGPAWWWRTRCPSLRPGSWCASAGHRPPPERRLGVRPVRAGGRR